MKFSENWLRSWVNPGLTSDELGHVLTMAGLEVEDLVAVAPAFNNVVVACVLSVEKHPDADRLNVCQVDVGEDQPLTIVCGAPNVAAGVKVPCARIGAVLPGDFKIKQAKVRGIPSFGMLCSEKELGLMADSEAHGLWLLPEDAPTGTSLREYLDLDDRLFTLKLTPNRSDCSGMKGVAREVAALTGSEFKSITVDAKPVTLDEQLSVVIEDAEGCPLYCGRVLRGVNAAVPTPVWMVRRLERSGLRSINAVVDVTNYVMWEMGQPMHAFDLSALSGGISVRRARAGEALVLLNEQTVTLDEQTLVIADDARVLALAGIMGGEGSGVDLATRDVFLEAAFFHPDAMAGQARRFGLATDSSFRFERGVDFAATRSAMERATQLILDICGGQAGEISAVQGELPMRAPIVLRGARVARVLGVALDTAQISDVFNRLQFEFTTEGDTFCVTPPSFRFDLAIESDLIEEVARLYGYDNIPALSPHAALTMLPHSETQRPLARILQTLVARDYQEIVSYAFVEEQVERDLCGNDDPVVLQNPIASNMAVMRSSLLGGLVGALRFNLNRRQSRVRLFEVGACFARTPLLNPLPQAGEGASESLRERYVNEYVQTQRLSCIAYGSGLPEQWGAAAKSVDFYDVKADLEALFAPQVLRFVAAVHPALHPGRSAQIYCGDKLTGWIGELHPQWQQEYDMTQAAIWFEVELGALMQALVPRLGEISRFLPVRRDLAVLVDEAVAVQGLLDAMHQAEALHVHEIVLFDVYRGAGVEAGKKSLAFRVLLQDTQKTLTDAEIEPDMALLVGVLNKCGAQLRM
ncbi:MAG: phenylalanine--tRNA ligase subunit beta [Gallionella sp.]|nr:phenylalanine--tRNA ligase subunit beta [Gallionella sp.]